MATRNYVPRANGEGSIGTEKKHWGAGYFGAINTCVRQKTYAVGAIAYCDRLPSWARLECVQTGTTATAEPALFAQTSVDGILITDGSAVWIVDDVRDGARVGDIILRPILRDGYVKSNGATVKASEYPRLLAWVLASNMTVTAQQYAQDCSKYVYDRAQDRLTLPNATGHVLMGGEHVRSVEAGLPNITGTMFFNERHSGVPSSGVFRQENTPSSATYHTPGDGHNTTVFFDASRSNPIYGRSDTVQPPALTMIAQIKY